MNKLLCFKDSSQELNTNIDILKSSNNSLAERLSILQSEKQEDQNKIQRLKKMNQELQDKLNACPIDIINFIEKNMKENLDSIAEKHAKLNDIWFVENDKENTSYFKAIKETFDTTIDILKKFEH